MNVVYRMWWRALMDLRLLVRFFAERYPKLAPWAVRLRTVAHVVAGNPVQSLAVVGGVWAWLEGVTSFGAFVAAVVVVWALVEVLHRSAFESGRGWWLMAWREAVRVHRRWPADWSVQAAKTRAVQAEVGTSKEPVASASLRPIADHPKMGWFPTIQWPQVSWWVGPPPGRTFGEFDEVLDVLAANNPRVVGMELDYDRSTDSYARLTVSFRSVLDAPVAPEATEVDAEPWTPVVVDGDDDTAVWPDESTGWSPSVIEGEAS